MSLKTPQSTPANHVARQVKLMHVDE